MLLCSGLEFPFDSSPSDDSGGVGGNPKSVEKIELVILKGFYGTWAINLSLVPVGK